MKKYILTGLICLFSFSWIRGQEYIPQITHRHYISDTTLFHPRHPWKAALETFGLNMLVWGFDRYLVKEDWAYINGHTIKSNFKKGPVWDTDQFTTNLFSHPYHGSLYFNAARSNGMTYSELMGKLEAKDIRLDRKVLADLAMNHPKAFEQVVNTVK